MRPGVKSWPTFTVGNFQEWPMHNLITLNWRGPVQNVLMHKACYSSEALQWILQFHFVHDTSSPSLLWNRHRPWGGIFYGSSPMCFNGSNELVLTTPIECWQFNRMLANSIVCSWFFRFSVLLQELAMRDHPFCAGTFIETRHRKSSWGSCEIWWSQLLAHLGFVNYSPMTSHVYVDLVLCMNRTRKWKAFRCTSVSCGC